MRTTKMCPICFCWHGEKNYLCISCALDILEGYKDKDNKLLTDAIESIEKYFLK